MASAWVCPPIVNTGGSKSYRVRWRDHSGRRRSKNFRKSREANAFCAEMNSKLNRHEFTPAESIPFIKLCEEWLEIKEPNLRPETLRGYRDQIRLRLIPEFGPYLVTGIAPRDVERFAARLAKSGLV